MALVRELILRIERRAAQRAAILKVVVARDKNTTDLAGAIQIEAHAIQSQGTPLTVPRTFM